MLKENSIHTSRRLSTWGLGIAVSGLLAACGNETKGFDPNALLEGEQVYKTACASCHGANLEGQPDWRNRKPDGKLPAPPHDASGHTWHHPRAQLFAITKMGMLPPQAPDNYLSDMPAFGKSLSDKQISNVLDYIENTWPAEIRAKRAERFGK